MLLRTVTQGFIRVHRDVYNMAYCILRVKSVARIVRALAAREISVGVCVHV